MRHAVILTLNCNDHMRSVPPRMLSIAAQERQVVTAMIAAAISIYARDYGIDVLNVGFSQQWKETKHVAE